jgi:ATP-dependent Clp protease adaptor protein ClpS
MQRSPPEKLETKPFVTLSPEVFAMSKYLPVVLQQQNGQDEQGLVVTKTHQKTKKPSLYKVILLNDDYTPMEFVVHILQDFFHKSEADAHQVMLQVHQKGAGVAGVFSYEVAETKVYQVNQYSRRHHHPLKCVMEKQS